METKEENEDPCKILLLEVSTEFLGKKFTNELIHLRDAFPFYINRTPYLNSNILSKTFYAVIICEILLYFQDSSRRVRHGKMKMCLSFFDSDEKPRS